jgi:hypothetical protein
MLQKLKELNMSDNVVGAPLEQPTRDVLPMLSGKGEEMVVTVHNPLSSDFRVQYARSLPDRRPESESEKFAREKAGMVIEKDMGQQQGHSVQFLILKAGETKNLPGNIAQIAVRQMVTYILGVRGRESGKNLAADPNARHEVEKEIIINITDSTSFMNQLQQTADEAIDKLNPVESTNVGQPQTSSKDSK